MYSSRASGAVVSQQRWKGGFGHSPVLREQLLGPAQMRKVVAGFRCQRLLDDVSLPTFPGNERGSLEGRAPTPVIASINDLHLAGNFRHKFA